MFNEISILQNLITNNMVNVSSELPYKLNHILIGDVPGIWSDYVPCCTIIPLPSQVIGQYIGEDTDRENILVRFYVSAGSGELSEPDTASGMMKLISMCEMMKYLVRKDPTFGSQMVTCIINSIQYYTAQSGNTNVARCAEISLSCLAKRLWNPAL